MDVSDHSDATALVEVPRLVYPNSRGVVVDKLDLVGHNVQPISFGQKGINFEADGLALLLQVQLQIPQSPQQLQLFGDDADVGNVIDQLLTLSKRVEIDFPRRLHPLKKEVGRKLLLLMHDRIALLAFEVI